jgi:hypothetical protein
MRTFFLAAIGVALVLTAGCASEPLTKAEVDGRVVCNVDRMDQVERSARRDNKEIHWLHCPEAVLRAM